jgi:hypothetical protein
MYPVKMLWHCSYWDYPQNGVAEYQDNIVWFQLAQDMGTNKLSYHIYQLSEDQANIVTTSQYMFSTYVGYHSWHVPQIRNTPHVRNDNHVTQYFNFYGKPAPGTENYNPVDIKQLPCIGTFYYDEFKYFHRQ